MCVCVCVCVCVCRGLVKYGGQLHLATHVNEVIVEGGRATGVKLKNGKHIKARKAVVSSE